MECVCSWAGLLCFWMLCSICEEAVGFNISSICLRCMTNLNIISHSVFSCLSPSTSSVQLLLKTSISAGHKFSQTISCLHKLSVLLCSYLKGRTTRKKDSWRKTERSRGMQREGGRDRPSTSREKVRSHAVGMLEGGLLAWLPHFSQP